MACITVCPYGISINIGARVSVIRNLWFKMRFVLTLEPSSYRSEEHVAPILFPISTYYSVNKRQENISAGVFLTQHQILPNDQQVNVKGLEGRISEKVRNSKS